MQIRKLGVGLAVSVLTLALASGCAEDDDDGKFVIGIKFDQPGLGFKNADGSVSGFDVDMARYIAEGLGYDEDEYEFKETVSANRETFLKDGTVDMILATYSINEERADVIDFAGPYYVAGQDLLVAADDDEITGPDALDGKKLCSVTGSTSATRVKEEYSDKVQLQEFDSYSKCVEALLAGQIDAVTTDNIILAGFVQQHPDDLKVVGETFSEERYGVGLPEDTDDCEKISDLIEQSFTDGAWEKAFDDNLGDSGYEQPAPPTLDACES